MIAILIPRRGPEKEPLKSKRGSLKYVSRVLGSASAPPLLPSPEALKEGFSSRDALELKECGGYSVEIWGI